MREKNRGLTLVEVLIVTVILGVTLLAFLTLTGQETRFAKSTSDRAYAIALANNFLAYLEPLDRGRLLAGTPLGGASVNCCHTLLEEGKWSEGTSWRNSRSEAALGQLHDWVSKSRAKLEFITKLVYPKDPQTGKQNNSFGMLEVICRVTWLNGRGMERCVELPRIFTLAP